MFLKGELATLVCAITLAEIFSRYTKACLQNVFYFVIMGHLQNIQSFETSIQTGNLQSYDEQNILTRQVRDESETSEQLI